MCRLLLVLFFKTELLCEQFPEWTVSIDNRILDCSLKIRNASSSFCLHKIILLTQLLKGTYKFLRANHRRLMKSSICLSLGQAFYDKGWNIALGSNNNLLHIQFFNHNATTMILDKAFQSFRIRNT